MSIPRPTPQDSRLTKLAKIVGYIFAAQALLSFGYAALLYVVNLKTPSLIESLSSQFSAITDPVAHFLPIASYAEETVNPRIHISAALIRHLFPVLTIFNLLLGIPSFIFLRQFSIGFKNALKANPEAFNRSRNLYLFLGGGSLYILFVDPILGVKLNLFGGNETSLVDYFSGSISPSLVVFCSSQLLAMIWAKLRA